MAFAPRVVFLDPQSFIPWGSYSLLQNVNTQRYLNLKETSFIKIKDLSQGIGFIINLFFSHKEMSLQPLQQYPLSVSIYFKLMEIEMLLRATKISQFVPKEDISVEFSSFIFFSLC